jgi:hypothetical protein
MMRSKSCHFNTSQTNDLTQIRQQTSTAELRFNQSHAESAQAYALSFLATGSTPLKNTLA